MRIIDVLSHTNVGQDELVYREPQQGHGDFRMGSQLIVGESQAAVFVRGGQALDVLDAGRHTLSVSNLPILSNLINLGTGGRTPFSADVYFINMRRMPQVGWGTTRPIYLRTDTGLGIILLRTHGVMELSVSDPMLFLKAYGMNQAATRLRDIKDRIQTILIGQINDLLLKSGAQNIIEANGLLEEIKGAMLVQVNQRFEEMGLRITALEANPFESHNVPIEELRDLVPLEVWLEVLERQKRLDIGMAAAQNEGLGGGLAAAGVGLGVGQNIGQQFGSNEAANMQQQMMQQQQMMMQMMQQMQNQGNTPPQTPPPAPATPPAAPAGGGSSSSPQTKAEVQALIDNLDVKLMSGEISETVYERLLDKWQKRLDEMTD